MATSFTNNVLTHSFANNKINSKHIDQKFLYNIN